jgi:hypothetical protein
VPRSGFREEFQVALPFAERAAGKVARARYRDPLLLPTASVSPQNCAISRTMSCCQADRRTSRVLRLVGESVFVVAATTHFSVVFALVRAT